MDAAPTAATWLPSRADFAALELSDEDERDVNETMALIVVSVRVGSISPHFANWLVSKLAEEKAEACARRIERERA